MPFRPNQEIVMDVQGRLHASHTHGAGYGIACRLERVLAAPARGVRRGAVEIPARRPSEPEAGAGVHTHPAGEVVRHVDGDREAESGRHDEDAHPGAFRKLACRTELSASYTAAVSAKNRRPTCASDNREVIGRRSSIDAAAMRSPTAAAAGQPRRVPRAAGLPPSSALRTAATGPTTPRRRDAPPGSPDHRPTRTLERPDGAGGRSPPTASARPASARPHGLFQRSSPRARCQPPRR